MGRKKSEREDVEIPSEVLDEDVWWDEERAIGKRRKGVRAE